MVEREVRLGRQFPGRPKLDEGWDVPLPTGHGPGSPTATVTAGLLIGATVGGVLGRVVAEAYLINNRVSSTAVAIAQRMLVGTGMGALIGLPLGTLVAKRVRIGFRSLLVGIAVTVGLGGIVVGIGVVQTACTRLVPVAGSSVAYRCVAQDPRIGLRLLIATGSLVGALLAWLASRRMDRISG